ncbi:hypothetical protein LPJ64_003153 [Coemansia asiatica]|uniref:Telomeric single stranded DNA binding POT1/Cdc13 domain-containing protein n=1 Tax=Coemansia asiatica TaxID=1052880 RepID=A0A9W7XKA3_9FUNG|nr:hypothetical protein LPJ64_003153 [Coemansia asiatica]
MDLFYALDCNSNNKTISGSTEFTEHLFANHLTPLSGLTPTDRLASLVVVVSSLGKVNKSFNGMDFYMSLRIVDPTICPVNPTGGQNSIAITVFKPSIEELPKIDGPGDILFLDNVQVNDFQGKITLAARRACRWNIINSSQELEPSLHPMVGYLREWWLQIKLSDPTLFSTSSSTSHTTNDTTTITTAAAAAAASSGVISNVIPSSSSFPVASLQPMVQNLSHNSSATKNKYLRTVSEIHPEMYPDLLLEILTMDPPQTDTHGRVLKHRCLATDYTECPTLVSDIYSNIPGRRVIALEFLEPDTMPKMPLLAVGKIYRLRHTHVVRDDEWGMCVRVSRDEKYPRTVIVVEVSPYSEDLKLHFERKAACQTVDTRKNNDQRSSKAKEKRFDMVCRESSDCQMLVVKKHEDAPVMTIAQINAKYRIKASVVRRHPSEPWETLDAKKNQHLLSHFILELRQDDSKCLALFLATTNQSLHALLGLEPLETRGNSGLLRTRIIKRIENLYALQHVDLVVASFIVPVGPDGSLARCLLITDILSNF